MLICVIGNEFGNGARRVSADLIGDIGHPTHSKETQTQNKYCIDKAPVP